MIKTKPTTGKLIRIYHDGKREVLANNQSFPALQNIKKKYIESGIRKENLKITY